MAFNPNYGVPEIDDINDSLSTQNELLDESSSNWDQFGLRSAAAGRSAVGGLSGLLSAQQNVYTSEQRLNVANINYILTVRQFGQGSIQAARALTELQQAQESVSVAQQQLNLRFVQFALQTGPQVYTALIRAAAAIQGVTVADFELNQSLTQTAILLGITLGLLTAGLAVFGGIMAGAAVSAQVNQTNNNYGVGANPNGAITASNNQLAAGVASAARP